MILQIKRGNRVIAESADFSYSPSLQEVRKLTCEVVSVVPIEFKAYNSKSESEYDTVVYNGNTFILYQAPSGDNLNEAGKYKYSLLFYGKEVLLQNVAFLDIVSGTGGEINKIRYTHGGLFQFWGDAKQLAARIEANIESYNASLGVGYTGIGTWTLNVDAEGELTEDMIDITDGTNLFEALKNFYDKFYLNYYFSTTANGGIITITDKARPSVNWTFKQGDGGGAVKVSSSVDTSTPVITRIIPQGGSRNVPPEYKKDAKPADESRYCPYILLPNDSAGNIRYYIDSEYGLKNYGVRGKTISNTFSGIYPSIRGKKLGDLYPSGLPEWDTYKADGEPDPQSGKVAGEGASAATRIDKIIGSTPIKSDDSDSFFIYMTSPGFNLGYKVYEDGDSSDKINDNAQPQYKPHAMFDKYRDFEHFDIYSTRAYYDQPVKVTATFSGKMLFSILPIGSDAVGKKVKINLRMVLNRVLGQASPLKEVVIGEEGATGMLEIPYDKTALVGYIEKGQNTTVTIRVEFTFDSDVPAGSCKIGFSEEMTCNIHFGNQDGSQDRFYYKYASVTDAVFSMRTGTYTGTEFKINKNGIIPLYGEVNGDTGETEEDVAMFNKGARYKISCYRTDSDNAKLPLYTDGKSPSIAAGTEFVILNIVMPESYVTMAENTLEKAAIDYLSRYDHENRTVSLDISSGFVAEHPNLFIDFIEGNMLKVRDDGIGVFDFSDNGQIVDMQLQIQSLEIKYSKENMFPSYSCTIARRKILSFYERLAQENQAASTQNTTNVTLGGSGTGSGTNIFSEQLLNDLIASFQKFNGWFEWDEVNQALRCKSAFYTNQWISALGAQSGSGEPGGGEGGLIKAVYGFADLGKTFDDSNLSNTFNAYTINEIWKLAKEGGMNTDKLWQELGKDDPTKKIHISHIPDNKFVTLDTEQTVTASKIFTSQLSTANVVPSVNNASTLGLESKRWENIYAVDANISGTVKTQALQVGDIKIIYDSVNKAVTFEHIDGSTEIGFYTRGWISALGVSPGGSGGSGGGSGVVNTVYSFANLTDGTTFSDSDLDNTFNAYTIKKLYDMAGQGGLDADAMWAELKKADSSKIIDASHIPTSVLDGRWVTLSTNQTITGQKTFTQQLKSTVATGVSPFAVDSTTIVKNLNVNFLDGRRADSFTSIIGRHSIGTSGTAPYNYIRLFRIANSVSYSTLRVDIDIKTRYHRALLFIDISTDQHPYGESGTAINISKLQLNGQGARLYYTVTKQSSGYNYYDIYYNSGAWNTGSYDVILRGINGVLVFEPKNTNMDNLPSGYVEVIKTPLDGDISGNAATATALKNSRTLWGQPFNGTANVSGDMTGVGSINMSGVLTIKNSTYNKQLVIRSTGSTAKNQGEGIWFRCDDVNQEVMLRHEWYDTFVAGYGLAVSKNDSLEAGDSNMFFYNTGRFISKAPQGTSPYQCVSTTVNANLNADYLDGLHENSFLRHRDTYGIDGYNTLWSQIGIRQYNNAKPDGMANPIYNYGAVVSLPASGPRLDIWYNHNSSSAEYGSNGIQYRSGWGDDKRPWRMLLDNVNYASYSDGRYVKKAGDNITGMLVMKASNVIYMEQSSDTSTQHIRFQGGGSDYGRIAFGATGSNAGWMEIASCDDGNEPIYARQYTGVFTTIKRTATLLDASGNTSFPGSVTSVRHISTVGTGTQPYQCNSTTLNTNLNADLLDGNHGAYYQNRMYDGFVSQYQAYDYIEFLRFVIPSGQTQLRAYVIFDLCRVEIGNEASGRVVLRIRRGTDNNASYIFYVTNFGRSWLPELRCTTNDGITWRVWMKCVKTAYDPYIVVKIVEQYPYGCVTVQSNGTTGTPSGSKYIFTASMAGLSNAANILVNARTINGTSFNGSANITTSYWGSTRTFYTNSHDSYRASSGVSVNGSSNVTLLLPSSIRCSDWFRSTGHSGWYHQDYGGGIYMQDSNFIRNYGGKRLRIQTDTYDTLQLVRTSGSGGSSIAFYNGGGNFRGQLGCTANSWFSFDTGTATANQNVVEISPAGGIHSKAEITAKASGSDIRLKKDIQNYNAMNIINKFRSVKYHWNDIAKANSEVYNNDYDQFGLIAQDLIAGGFEQWVRDVFHDYYTVTYERLIPVVWKGLQEVDDEVTRLKKRVRELEKRLGINN